MVYSPYSVKGEILIKNYLFLIMNYHSIIKNNMLNRIILGFYYNFYSNIDIDRSGFRYEFDKIVDESIKILLEGKCNDFVLKLRELSLKNNNIEFYNFIKTKGKDE